MRPLQPAAASHWCGRLAASRTTHREHHAEIPPRAGQPRARTARNHWGNDAVVIGEILKEVKA